MYVKNKNSISEHETIEKRTARNREKVVIQLKKPDNYNKHSKSKQVE